MKKHLWFLAGLLVFLASCFGSGGGGGGEGGGGGPSIIEGPKASYLIYSAFDGTDYELYLLNPNLPPPAAADAPPPDPQAPQFEILQLTSNETADIMPSGVGTNLIWQCDDGAGSELCTMDMLGKKFSQLTTVAGGGALGRTIDSPLFPASADLIVAETSPQGRAGHPSNGLMKLNPTDKSLVMKNLSEITGVTDEFSEQFLNSQFLTKGGNVFFRVDFTKLSGGDRPDYDWDKGSYMMNSAGEIKKMDNYDYIWDRKDSVLAVKRLERVFGVIDQTTAQFSPVRSFETVDSMDPCLSFSSFRGLSGMRVISTEETSAPVEEGGPPSVLYKLYAYNDSAKELKLLKEIAPTSFGFGCFQSEDDTKALVILPAGEGNFVYTALNIDTGEESEIYRPARNESFISMNGDLSAIALLAAGDFDPMMGRPPEGRKLIFVDAVSKAKTEVDASVMRGYFLKGGKKFVFESAGGDAFIYDLLQKKLVSLPMSVYPRDFFDQSEQDKFIFLRRQSCPVDDCNTYDSRATTSFKIYKADSDRSIDVPNNGKDIIFPAWIELTQDQYAKWKETVADAEFVKSAKPSADSGGPALRISSRFVNLSPDWLNTTSALAYSRQPGASLTWTRVLAGAESPIESEVPTSRPDPLSHVLGLYPAFSVATVEFGRPDTGSGVLTVRVNDGATIAEENIGYYMEPPEPPELPHPPTITAVTTTDGRTVADGSTWVCSLSEVTGLESDLASALAHNAAAVAREVADIGDSAVLDVTAIARILTLGTATRNSLNATATAISAWTSIARVYADGADLAAGEAILASVTSAQINTANASADTTRSATISVRDAITKASALAAGAASTTEDSSIDENAGRIARAAIVANVVFARGNFARNILPGCAVSVNASDTGGDILEPFVEGLTGGATSWMVEGEAGSGTITFTVQRPADGTGLPAPIGEARITARDERGDEAVFRLNLSVTY